MTMGGDRFPWIKFPEGLTEINFDLQSNYMSRCWDIYTGEEYTTGLTITIYPEGRPIKLGIEWRDMSSYSLTFLVPSSADSVSPYLLTPIASRVTSLRGFFSYNKKIDVIPNNFFKGLYPYVDFNGCCANMGNLKATPKVDGLELWEAYPYADGTRCFEGCSQLPNWNEIPSNWKSIY